MTSPVARLAVAARPLARVWASVLALLSLFPVPVAARPKTDIIVLRNGDRLQGEIVSLQYGQLRFKTDSMGTLSVEWPDVVAIESRYLFTIESDEGAIVVGSLATAPDSTRVFIRGAHRTTELATAAIARLSQLETSFWKRIDGTVSLGFNYEKSTEIALLKSALDSQYKTPTLAASLEASADLSRTAEQETKENLSAASDLRLIRKDSKFWVGSLSWQRNEELGIDSRVQLGAGWGFYPRRSLESEISVSIGLNGNQEWATGSGEQTLSVEGDLGADWRIFRFRDPETSLVTDFSLLPSLTESERYRLAFDVTLSIEVIKDLTIDLSYTADYDSKPPAGGSELDTGIGTSIGYKF